MCQTHKTIFCILQQYNRSLLHYSPQRNFPFYPQIKRSRFNTQSFKYPAHRWDTYAIPPFHSRYLSLLYPYTMAQFLLGKMLSKTGIFNSLTYSVSMQSLFHFTFVFHPLWRPGFTYKFIFHFLHRVKFHVSHLFHILPFKFKILLHYSFCLCYFFLWGLLSFLYKSVSRYHQCLFIRVPKCK